MKKIKNYQQYNESLLGSARRLFDSERKSNDQKAIDFFNKVKEDFIQCDSNLYKVKMVLRGDYKTLWYRFKYADAKFCVNSMGNNNTGDIHLTIQSNRTDSYIKIVEINANPNHDPNYIKRRIFDQPTDEEREKLRIHDESETRYAISKDIADKFINFFKKEYERQYPEIEGCDYYNGGQIRDIKNNLSPVRTYTSGTNKDGEVTSKQVRKDQDEKIVKDIIKNSPSPKKNK